MNNKLAHRGANDGFEMSQADIAEKLFLHVNTVGTTEKRALEKVKQLLAERNITAQNIFED